MKHDYIKYTRILWAYSGRKRKATGHVLLTVSPYRDAEGYSQLRSYLHYDSITADPGIGGGIGQS